MRLILSELNNFKYLLILELVLLAVFAVFSFLPFIALLAFILIFPLIYFSFEKPVVAIHLLMFSILAGSLGAIKFGGKAPSILFVDIFFVIFLAIFSIKVLLNTKSKVEIPQVAFLWILFLIWGLLSLITAVDSFRALFIWKSYLAGFVVFTFTFFVLKKEIHVKSIFLGLILWGLILSLIEIKILMDLGGLSSGIVGLFFKKNLLATSWGRSNYLAAFFVLIIPLTIGYLVYTKSIRLKIFILVSLLFMSSAMILTLSRGGILALAISLLFLFSRIIKAKTFIPILIAFLIVTLVILINPLTYVLIERTTTFERSFSYFTRINFYEDVWNTFLQYPITGVGLGNLGFYSQFIISSHASAHNILLGMLGETGIIGTILFFSILTKIFIDFYKYYRRETNESLKIFKWSCFSALLGVLIHSMMEPNFEGMQFSIILWVFAAAYFKSDLIKLSK